jgi:hypothetical protein
MNTQANASSITQAQESKTANMKATINALAETGFTISAGSTQLDSPSYSYTTLGAAAEPLFTIDQFMSAHFPNLTLDQLKHIVSLHPEANL